MSETRAVLFDLDGTLVDLPVDIEPARARIAAMFSRRGWARPMRPLLSAIEEAAGAVATDESERAGLVDRARATIDEAERVAAGRAIARPGAIDTVRALAGRGVSLGIVTDNGRACVRPALDAVGLGTIPWRTFVSRDEARRPKPDPDGIERAAAELLPGGGLLWMVGDSPRDAEAARAARVDGVRVRMLGVRGGRGEPDALRAAGADAVLDDLGALLPRLSGNG